jgi:hypothetical protein
MTQTSRNGLYRKLVVAVLSVATIVVAIPAQAQWHGHGGDRGGHGYRGGDRGGHGGYRRGGGGGGGNGLLIGGLVGLVAGAAIVGAAQQPPPPPPGAAYYPNNQYGPGY